MNSKILVLTAVAFLAASMPSTATADILEITFSGTIAEGSGDMTNVFGFGTGNALDGRAATGVLRIDLSAAPPGILNKPSAGMNYWDANASQTGWNVPGYSWIESSFSIEGHAAPDLVPGTANYANADISVVNEGGTADHWLGQDWATTVLYPSEGQSFTYEDLLEIQLYNADFLSGFDLNQQFTLTGGPDNYIGVGTFRYTDMGNYDPDPYRISAGGYINITSVTAKLLKAPNSAGPTPDIDCDGKTDITVFRPSDSTWYSLPSGSPNDYTALQWGMSDDVSVAADYDGDGKSDLSVWRPSTGIWYILPSGTPGTYTATAWGTNGDIPVPGDYDGDGKDDRAVWRPGTGIWYVLPSASPSLYTATQWGMDADIPVPGDYDGDGKADTAVFRPSAGTWFIIKSSVPGSYTSMPWGVASDIPVPGDFDADGKTDVAVWRPSIGVWYIRPSTAGGYTTTQWGMNGDTPVSGDYDGDGKADIAVWRPSEGVWYILPSGSPGSYTAREWGMAGDMPISSITGILNSIP